MTVRKYSATSMLKQPLSYYFSFIFTLLRLHKCRQPYHWSPCSETQMHWKWKVTHKQYRCNSKTNYICTLQGWDTWKIQQWTSTGQLLQSGLHRPNKDPGAPSCIGYHSLTTGFHLSGKKWGRGAGQGDSAPDACWAKNLPSSYWRGWITGGTTPRPVK